MNWNFFSQQSPQRKPRIGSPANLLPIVDAETLKYIPKDIVISSGVDEQRNIFGLFFTDEMMRYSEFELTMVRELDSCWGSEGDPLQGTQIEETHKMRLLQGVGWDVPKAVESIRAYVKWRLSSTHTSDHSPDRTDDETWLYFYGRDKCMRPVMYIDCFRLLEKKGDSHSLTFVQDAIVDAMNYFVTHLAAPGHVEQVVVIADLDGCTAWNAPVEEMEKCAITLTSKFRGRLNKLFVLNTPLVFYAFWSVVKVFIPERTLAKIFLFRGKNFADLIQYINEDQIDPVLRRLPEHSG
jgi:hypothetical protein